MGETEMVAAANARGGFFSPPPPFIAHLQSMSVRSSPAPPSGTEAHTPAPATLIMSHA